MTFPIKNRISTELFIDGKQGLYIQKLIGWIISEGSDQKMLDLTEEGRKMLDLLEDCRIKGRKLKLWE